MQPASFYHMLSVIYLLIIARTIVLVQIDFLFQFVLNHDMLLFTPFSVTRFAMHRIYANRINSRGPSYALRLFSSGSTVASMVKKHAQPPTRLETGSAQNTPSVPRPFT